MIYVVKGKDIMGISGINGITDNSLYTSGISKITENDFYTSGLKENDNTVSFDTLFQSALDMINETNQLTNEAEEEEIKYAMGESSSIHELQLAQEKANISLQYTVAVRNGIIDAYKEIMNMQF